MASNQLIFISGGVRSGKSSFAELYAAEIAKEKDAKLYYLATSISFDPEMKSRIEHHQETRSNSDEHWKTIERSSHIYKSMNQDHRRSVMLLDCLTIWLNNEFYERKITEEISVNGKEWNEFKRYMMCQIYDIQKWVDTLIIVSNDIFHDAMNQTPYVHLYSRMLGELHQLIVSEADQAFAVESCIPILMKKE